MRSKFDQELEILNKELVKMGALCETAIAMATKAIEANEKSFMDDIYAISTQIEQKEREIESLCMKLILRQQPVAKDLRTISSALKMITDMQRIGHQSADIIDIIIKGDIHSSNDTLHIKDMAIATIKMVTESIDAFVNKDIETAKKVMAYDDVVDEYFSKIRKDLAEKFSEPNTDVEYALNVLLIAKYFERIGDHAVNISDWVVFSITGQREGE